MQRKVLIAAGGVLLLGMTWLGASIYVGNRAEKELQDVVKSSTLSRSYRLRNLQHESGLFSSSGRVELALVDTCADDTDKPEWFTASVSYRLSHFISPLSLLGVEWSVMPSGEVAPAFESLFNGQAKLEGKGRVRWSGSLESDLNLPAINAINDGLATTISPSTGSVSLGKDTFEIDWRTAKIAYRGNGEAMEVEGFSVKSKLVSVSRGLGKTSLEAEKLGTSSFSAAGLALAMDVTEKGDRLDMRLIPSAKSINVSGKKFENFIMEMAVNGLHAKSVEQLIDLSEKSCYFRSLTMEETKQVRDSLRTLVYEGLSAGVPKLAGKLDGGAIDGKLIVSFGKTAGEVFELEKVLTASGELSLTGKSLKAEESQFMVSAGIAEAIPEGLKASIDYASGILKVNGKVFDATVFSSALKGANMAINAMLNDKVEQSVPVVLPEPAVEIEEQSPLEGAPPQDATEGV